MKTHTEVHSISPTDFLPDIRSATISKDSTVTAFAQINPGGKGFNILVRNNLGADVITTHRVRTEIIKLLDISTSGRLLAFLEQTPEGPERNNGSRYNLVVLDIASGYRHILDSFEGHIIPTSSDNFYDNTSTFPVTAFFGNNENDPILFAFEPANNKGCVWRKSPRNCAWKSTWHTTFDATFKPLKFFDNDNSIMGIYREGYYEFSILSADKHHHIAEVRWSGYGLMLAAWSGRFHCCINTECQSEKGFKVIPFNITRICHSISVANNPTKDSWPAGEKLLRIPRGVSFHISGIFAVNKLGRNILLGRLYILHQCG